MHFTLNATILRFGCFVTYVVDCSAFFFHARLATLQERVNISKKYYIGGFFLLPWLWIINTFWFFPFAVKSGADPKLRKSKHHQQFCDCSHSYSHTSKTNSVCCRFFLESAEKHVCKRSILCDTDSKLL